MAPLLWKHFSACTLRAKKLTDLARSLWQSMNEFRKARQDLDEELHNAGTQSTQPSACQQGASLSGAQQVQYGKLSRKGKQTSTFESRVSWDDTDSCEGYGDRETR
jgi:Sec-independent protein translocase protein TatA